MECVHAVYIKIHVCKYVYMEWITKTRHLSALVKLFLE